MNSSQYTIRNISSKTDTALRARARRQHKSLNKTLLEILDQAADVRPAEDQHVGHHDFDDLSGSWTNDPGFDEALQDMRTVDPKDWQ